MMMHSWGKVDFLKEFLYDTVSNCFKIISKRIERENVRSYALCGRKEYDGSA